MQSPVLKTWNLLLAAKQIARVSNEAGMAAIQKLATSLVEKNVNNQLDDSANLSLGFIFLQNRDFMRAEYFLFKVAESKNSKLKSAAYNALGVIQMHDDRIPEAVDYWKKSLQAHGGAHAAQLNLGMTALRFGDYEKAGRLLSSIPRDWYIESGLLVVDRFMGRRDSAKAICDKILSSNPKQKQTLFNCGLLEFQEFHNYKKASQMIGQATQVSGGPNYWEELAYKTIERIDATEQEELNKAAQKKMEQQKAAPKTEPGKQGATAPPAPADANAGKDAEKTK